MFSQLHFLPYFTPATFYLFLKVKSEQASCLLTQGTFKKSLKGGPPYHRYIKARRRHPRVDRLLQSTHTTDYHAKKLPEASFSLKWTVLKLCWPAHLYPNTPRTYKKNKNKKTNINQKMTKFTRFFYYFHLRGKLWAILHTLQIILDLCIPEKELA